MARRRRGLATAVFGAAVLVAAVAAAGAPVPQAPAGGDSLRLSLAEAVARAEAQAHAVAMARADLDEARGRRRAARSGYLPSVSLAEQVVRSDDPVAAFGARLRQERFGAADFAVDALNEPEPITDLRTVLEVHQPLFSSGRSRAERRAAAAGQDAAAAGLERTRQQVGLQAAEAYWGLALAEGAAAVAAAALDAGRSHARDADAAWRAGASARSDRLEADLRVAELEADAIDAGQRREAAADGLTLLLALPAGTPVVTADALVADDADTGGTGPGIPRADVRALRRQRDAARALGSAARSAYLPQLAAFAQFALDADAPFGGDGESWTAGAVLRWDVFTGFAARGQAEAARARALRLERQVDLLEATVDRDLRQAQRGVAAAGQRLAVAAAAAEGADEHLRVCRLEFAEGAIPSRALLDAQAAWRGAHLRRLQALHDLRVGHARLAFARGLGPAAPTQEMTP